MEAEQVIMLTSRAQIRDKAIEILKDNPEGVRYSQLVKKIKEALPVIPARAKQHKKER
jgi:3-deoxy-D-arabino-heptulosonate 7-phosphate (DAHP) synthase class II